MVGTAATRRSGSITTRSGSGPQPLGPVVVARTRSPHLMLVVATGCGHQMENSKLIRDIREAQELEAALTAACTTEVGMFRLPNRRARFR